MNRKKSTYLKKVDHVDIEIFFEHFSTISTLLQISKLENI